MVTTGRKKIVRKRPPMPDMKFKVKEGVDENAVRTRLARRWNQMVEQLKELDHHRSTSKVATEAAAAIQEDILAVMMDLGLRNVTVEAAPGFELQCALVEGTSLHIDERELRTRIGDDLWGQVTRQVLDTKMLEAKVADGTIDDSIIAAVSTEQPRTPFVKITTKRR